MACLGVLFALTEEQERSLLAARGDDEVRDVEEEIEDAWDDEHLQEVQKAWDAIHRCLSDGTLNLEGGRYPLNRAILGGKPLHEGDSYIVSYVPRNEVSDVAAALAEVAEPWFRERFFALADTDFPQMYVDEQECEITWAFLEDVREFYRRADEEGRAVIFTADQ